MSDPVSQDALIAELADCHARLACAYQAYGNLSYDPDRVSHKERMWILDMLSDRQRELSQQIEAIIPDGLLDHYLHRWRVPKRFICDLTGSVIEDTDEYTKKRRLPYN